MDHTMSPADIEAIIERELPLMPGWCTPAKGKRMAELARGAKLCVELGVFGGRSLVAVALTLRCFELGRVDGIDPYTAVAALEGHNDPANDEWWGKLDYEAVARTAQEALYRLDLVQHARIIRMRSQDVVGFYEDGTVDLLHQDANHAEETSCEEVTLWAPKIRAGGLWVMDDVDWDSTEPAQKRLSDLGFTCIEKHDTWAVYRAP